MDLALVLHNSSTNAWQLVVQCSHAICGASPGARPTLVGDFCLAYAASTFIQPTNLFGHCWPLNVETMGLNSTSCPTQLWNYCEKIVTQQDCGMGDIFLHAAKTSGLAEATCHNLIFFRNEWTETLNAKTKVVGYIIWDTYFKSEVRSNIWGNLEAVLESKILRNLLTFSKNQTFHFPHVYSMTSRSKPCLKVNQTTPWVEGRGEHFFIADSDASND